MANPKELPTLAGVKVRTRKRDEKTKYDSTTFCEQIVEGINKTDGNFDEITKFLDQSGSTLDYRRYAEPLFDILIAGSMLAPGGKREAVIRTEFCVFSCEPMKESIRAHVQLLVKLLRRYKYLQKSLEEEVVKILKFLKAFSDQERRSLAMYIALCLSENHIPASVVSSLFSEALVKEGVSLEFATLLFQAWLTERDISAVGSALRKAQLEGKLLELMPPSKQSIEHFEEHFNAANLESIVKFHKSQENLAVKKKLGDEIDEMLEAQASHEEILEKCQQYISAEEGGLTDVDITVILWRSIMNAVEWNKKEELLAEQALKHLKQHYELFIPFTHRGTPQLTLLIKMQEFCYENMNFMKVFHKIVLHFYKSEILSEDAILKWYNEAHSDKGKNVFRAQMKKMVEWLQSAEEESDSESQPQEQNV
eukprot:Em0023g69a